MMDWGLNWQTIAAILLLAVAVIYVIRVIVRSWKGGSHGDCDGCDLPKKK